MIFKTSKLWERMFQSLYSI